MNTFYKIFLLLSLPLWAISQTTVVDIVVNSDDHNTLEAAVLAADLAGTLSGDGPFTLFAPTDAAFDALPDGVLQSLLDDPSGALTSVLLYHAVSGTVLSTDLSDGMTAPTINGKNIDVTITGGNVFINDAQVILADITTDNGVVHVIDAVLVPPRVTVVDVVVNSPDHTILETAVLAADLAGTLSGDGPFTLFAPTDAAFDALPDGVLQSLVDDPFGALTSVLLYHAVNGTVLSTDLSDGMTAPTINGKNIDVTITGGNVFINDAQVIVADIATDNGVVHVIDAVLVPPRVTVVDVVVNSPDHTILETAVLAADLAGTLSGDGPFTLFAPTDAAFEALPDGVLQSLIDDPMGSLITVLTYHALAGQVLSTDLTDGMTAATVNGEEVTVTINTDGVFIDNAKVILADVITDNGVVHVLDAVLVPSGISSVTDTDFGELTVYPNPASEYINIDMKNFEGMNTKVELYDSTGRLMETWRNISDQQTLNISAMNSGIYFLRLDNSIINYTKKVVIN